MRLPLVHTRCRFLYRRLIRCDARQRLLPLSLPCAYRLRHALPRCVEGRLAVLLKAYITPARLPYDGLSDTLQFLKLFKKYFMTDTVQISAQLVNELRTRTGAQMMECKRALVEAAGNMDKAIDILRTKGLANAAKKADRTANDGLVATALSPDQSQGAIVMMSCETDFVAKTDDFVKFMASLAQHALKHTPATPEAMLTQSMEGATVKDTITGVISKLGENMQLRAVATYKNSFVEQYIHIGGKVGVLLSIQTGNPMSAKNPALKTLAKDICMHIAASSPAGIHRDEVPADLVAKEKEIAAEQAKGKPAAAVDKIIQGKLEKFYAQNCLLEQPFVKNPDISVKALVEQTAKQMGDTVTISAFTRLQIGG